MRRLALFVFGGLLSSCSLIVPLFGSERCDSAEPSLVSCDVGEIAVLCENNLIRKHQCGAQEVCLPFEQSKEVGNLPQNFDGCGVPISCGNGSLEQENGEECDDANGVDTDGCRSSCQINVCGDGVINFGDSNNDGVSDENCEPPGVGSCSSACTLGCQSPADCEDDPNILANQSCIDRVFCEDDPEDEVSGAVCRAELTPVPPDVLGDCIAEGCFAGVGVVSVLLPDGNTCENLGQPGSCFAGVCRIEGHCGNGLLEVNEGEQCDDGNQNNNDLCDNDCLVNCLVDITNPLCGCGNGVVDAGEQCDDGNQINNDFCSNQCQPARCGDGILQPLLEQCDDGNLDEGDGCSASCLDELCGDNQAIGGELCDGLDLRDQDCVSLGFDVGNLTCQPTCQSFNTQSCQILSDCGDGDVDLGEECDNGAQNSDTLPDACRTNCQLPRCGDFVVDTGEFCDDGNTNLGDGCDNCFAGVPLCGNNITEPGEACDDGNLNNGDGCSSSCQQEFCGNGVINAGEQCDDGNQTPGDGCDNCVLEGGTCSNITQIEVTGASNSNFSTANNFSNNQLAGCFAGTQENIFLLSFSPPLVDTDSVSIIVTPDNGVNLGFYLRTVCDGLASEFVCENAAGTSQQEARVFPATLIPPGSGRSQVFLIVDTIGTPGGYSLGLSRF